MSGKMLGLPGGIIVRRYSECRCLEIDDVDGKYIVLLQTANTGPTLGLYTRTSEGIWVVDGPTIRLTPEDAIRMARDIIDLYGGRR